MSSIRKIDIILKNTLSLIKFKNSGVHSSVLCLFFKIKVRIDTDHGRSINPFDKLMIDIEQGRNIKNNKNITMPPFNDAPRKMFTGNWKCSECEKDITELPFEPDEKRMGELKCRDCWKKSRGQFNDRRNNFSR